MTEQDAQYQAARRRVMRRFRRRFIFAVDVLLFVLTLVGHNQKTDVLVVWLPVLVAHFIYAFDIWGNWIERATRREMEHTPLQSDSAAPVATEKRKRSKAKRLALSDDGELSDDSDDEAVYYAEERRE